MIFAKRPVQLSTKTKRGILETLARSLDKEYLRQVNAAAKLAKSPAYFDVLIKITQDYSRAIATLDELIRDQELFKHAESRLKFKQIYADLLTDLQSLADEDYQARKAIFTALELILSADRKLRLYETQTDGSEEKRIIIHTDQLYQAYLALFPAEKMMVASGRSDSDTITLGAQFDITGTASAGHVRADPDRLGRALIAMEYSDSFLAAWIHSHPGRGISATQPSSIDLNQHQDWIRNYSANLVSAILVEDGWVRFWGRVLEDRLATLEFIGSGVKKETENEWVYRLS